MTGHVHVLHTIHQPQDRRVHHHMHGAISVIGISSGCPAGLPIFWLIPLQFSADWWLTSSRKPCNVVRSNPGHNELPVRFSQPLNIDNTGSTSPLSTRLFDQNCRPLDYMRTANGCDGICLSYRLSRWRRGHLDYVEATVAPVPCISENPINGSPINSIHSASRVFATCEFDGMTEDNRGLALPVVPKLLRTSSGGRDGDILHLRCVPSVRGNPATWSRRLLTNGVFSTGFLTVAAKRQQQEDKRARTLRSRHRAMGPSNPKLRDSNLSTPSANPADSASRTLRNNASKSPLPQGFLR